MKTYLDFWEKEFNKMGKIDKRALGVPFVSIFLWLAYGIIFPNLLIPIKYFILKWLNKS